MIVVICYDGHDGNRSESQSSGSRIIGNLHSMVKSNQQPPYPRNGAPSETYDLGLPPSSSLGLQFWIQHLRIWNPG